MKNVNLQNLKLTNGSYKLIALLYNPQRYQIISYFKIGKQNYL
ncbi:MAG TPA: hypothetical protein PLM75_00780 [bacterium]|nr:hypothetical protein [bacterium]